MRIRLVSLALAASAMLFAGSARAQVLEREQVRTRHPGAAALAAIGNVVYAPVRFALTVFNAGAGGATGQLTMGDAQAAADVWGLGSGQGFLQPEMFTGQQSLDVGDLRYNLKVTQP